jgi:nucleoid-associated protein YgaU
MTSPYSSYDAVTVRRVAFPRATLHYSQPAYRMSIAQADKPTNVIRVPYAPMEVDHTRGGEYADVPRPGKKPALVYKNAKRREQTMSLLLADKYAAVPGRPTAPVRTVSAMSLAQTLSGWAEAGTRLKITYGGFESGTWRITECSIRTIYRGQTHNDFTAAEVTLTFSEVQDIAIGTGPVSGGGTSKPPATKTPSVKTYVVKRGDTLSKISYKFYGTTSKWRKIADYNKIKNPKTLAVGKKLKIPK